MAGTSDSFMREVPFTREQLLEDRRRALLEYGKLNGSISAPDQFTCDICTLAPKCSLAFDIYNTDGDCLLEK